MKKTLFLSLLFATTMLSAQKPVELPLWPDGAPNTNGLTGNQEDLEGGRVANVVNPSITVYRPAKPNGMAVIMCPGGGYGRLAMNHEGHDMAAWFTTQGITYAVLKYRMPNGHHEVPLSDAEQAIRLMRGHAKEWGVNPNRIGIMGASAGGHLAASLATLYSSDATRPDFQVLFYPVISMLKGVTHSGSRKTSSEKRLPPNWNRSTRSNGKYLPKRRKHSSCCRQMMQAFCPSTASAISSPCKSRKFPPLCMSTPPADMAGAFVTVSPTNANGPGNWKNG